MAARRKFRGTCRIIDTPQEYLTSSRSMHTVDYKCSMKRLEVVSTQITNKRAAYEGVLDELH